MPTITVNKEVFEELVGKKLPLEELKDRISMLGTDLEGIEGNEIKVEIFPNRPDMLSVQGFARAFSSFIGVNTGLKEYKVESFGSSLTVKDLPSQWPYAIACIVKGLNFDNEKIKEIIQVQEKLGTTFTRNRKKGGLGLYPLEKINFPVTFTSKKPEDITFRPLEFPTELTAKQILSKHPKGREHGYIMEGWDKYPVFIDSKNKIMSMPPIINSHDVGKIDETTTDVFIEGTGPDLNTIMSSLYILTTTLADMGGKIYSLEIIYPDKKFLFPDFTPEKIELDLKYINKILGLELDEKKASELLARMGFGYENGKVQVPAYRSDILHQIDFAEDIAIAYGYENFEEVIPKVATVASEDKFERFAKKLREILIGVRLLEIKNYHLVKYEDLTEKMLEGEKLIDDVIKLKNSLGEHNTLRYNLMVSLLKTLTDNQDKEQPLNIFEIGRVFSKDKSTETGILEKEHLAVAICHEKADFTELKQVLEILGTDLGVELIVKESDEDNFISGRAGKIMLEGEEVGIIGEVHPQVLNNWNLVVPVSLFEIDVELLLGKILF
ncbi:MAG: phenylalanine--tRNA ligase subunit beta [archaeon]|nr:phenylalanine--tRNA ligase subunit beta [Nanoarchaeota archaeon]